MLKTKAVTVDSIRAGDVIFLNDLKSLDSMGTFYMECYIATSNGAELSIDLQSAQVLEVSRIDNAYRVEVITQDNRSLDLEVPTWEMFSTLIPEKIPVGQLQVGDEILLRGDYNPAHLKKNYQYIHIARHYGFISEILKIRKTWRGNYRLTVSFAGVKKLRLTVDSDILFEASYNFRS